jgi:hypothetical protein
MTVRKLLLGTPAALMLAISPAIALEFPGTCITLSATVTSITGIDTRNAEMEARYTAADVTAACHQGYVDQSDAPPDVCIARHKGLVKSPPLHANADCVAGVITIDGSSSNHMPMHADCASGGLQAIAAFKTLCPSYGGAVELQD